jgi:predicted XRE-type DNA-binding protein
LSSGNVFASLGPSDPEKILAKAERASKIGEILRGRGLTQSAAAELFGIDEPKISRLLGGYLPNFSTERLMHFLTLLGQDVEIAVRPAPRSRRVGLARVVAAA